jgi:hypothetical protein
MTPLEAPMASDELAVIGEGFGGPEWKPSVARLLGVNVRTIKRWAAGENPVPPGAALQLRLAVCAQSAVRATAVVVAQIDADIAAGARPGIALSERPGDATQRVMNDLLIAMVRAAGRDAKFRRVATAADAPADRALEAALGRPGSRA